MKRILSIAATISLLGSSAAMANCPTLATAESAKYLKVYAKDVTNIGASWRLMIRPRNGACFESGGTAHTGFQSPVKTAGQADGAKTIAAVHDGAHNCSDNYDSYISIDIPSYANVYKTSLIVDKDHPLGNATSVGWKVCMTKGKDCYSGAAVVVPDSKVANQIDVMGVCIN